MQQIPVIVVLGHVDHGKTTLLDAIRNTSVQKSEPSGITQNIYISEIVYNKKVFTFVDTPGHEVFSLMRLQGGRVADMALLIVAADEGVKPQTLESLEIIKKQGIKFIVVITKIDTQGANVEKVKNDLLANGIYLEGLGGDVPYVEVSAVKKQGIDKLMDTISLFVEVEGLLDPDISKLKLEEFVKDKFLLENTQGYGIVLDSTIDKYKGKTIFGVWKYGNLQQRDFVIINDNAIRVSRLFDANQKSLKQAFAGKAFILSGLDILPLSGDVILKVKDAKKVAKYLDRKNAIEKAKQTKTLKDEKVLLQELFEEQAVDKNVVPLFIKTDVEASKRSVVPSVNKFNSDLVEFKVVGSDVGEITDKDVDVAHAFKAQILGFRVNVNKKVLSYAEGKGVLIKIFDTVYKMYEYLEQLRKDIEDKQNGPQIIGKAKVLKVFVLSDKSIVAGSRVIDGEVRKNGKVRVIRNNETIAEYPINGLKILKQEVDVVTKGKECGINLGKEADIQEDDILEFFV